MVLAFGKHKGKDITKLPSNYLIWLSEHVNVLKDGNAIIDACESELDYRYKYDQYYGFD